jgi:hypothetical protein
VNVAHGCTSGGAAASGRLLTFDIIGGAMSLVPSRSPENRELDDLRSRVSELETALAGRDAEVTRVKADLAAFKISYRQQVGLLHEELDELEQAISEAELGELSKRARTDAGEARGTPAGARPEPAPKYSSDAVRRLFRDVAKAIHPDLAGGDGTRDRRHSLMIAANQAYAVGDEERLRRILRAWEQSPEAVPDGDPEAARLRLERRIAQIDEQMAMLAADLADLQATPLWKLKVMVDQAAARGKDLVREMVARLERDIMVARNRLDAIQSRP